MPAGLVPRWDNTCCNGHRPQACALWRELEGRLAAPKGAIHFKVYMITEQYLELIPTYGRDYKNRAAVETAFLEGKDFEVASLGFGGRYCSVRDFAPGTLVNLRYKQKRSVTVFVVPTSQGVVRE